jgi:hypothetical protein
MFAICWCRWILQFSRSLAQAIARYCFAYLAWLTPLLRELKTIALYNLGFSFLHELLIVSMQLLLKGKTLN